MTNRQDAVSHMKWFRFPHELTSSGGVRDLTDFEVRVLVAMMCLASQSPPLDRLDGALTANPTGKPLNIKSIHVEVWSSPDEATTQAAVDSLSNTRFVEQREDGAYRLRMWWQQYANDTSTPRVHKHRAKKKGETPPLNEAQEPPTSLPDDSSEEAEQNRAKGNSAGNVSSVVSIPADHELMPT